ncbi:hypothetical protein HETIRDRAFT_157739 [Heterobasidion irregulare TC 32-1]|uniref:Uncharacterized protein n=1 Tax=Heterobasidion irregulare (strain TC 32-1) TaxID=747525 RepID=W4JNZ8_HETIT|nr:uncharacterized protein HETIRDRAFT_157739 [Heterobasidion irregulare TC 32-1]ETW74785.1 hypothetical protein HETIRDRAFT_157739 [Heterobasidion irregulare TC 32-1]
MFILSPLTLVPVFSFVSVVIILAVASDLMLLLLGYAGRVISLSRVSPLFKVSTLSLLHPFWSHLTAHSPSSRERAF